MARPTWELFGLSYSAEEAFLRHREMTDAPQVLVLEISAARDLARQIFEADEVGAKSVLIAVHGIDASAN